MAKISFLRTLAGLSLRETVASLVTSEELGVEPLSLRIKRNQLKDTVPAQTSVIK